MPAPEEPRDKDWLDKAKARACLVATREVSLETGRVTVREWAELARSKAVGFKFSKFRLQTMWDEVASRQLRIRMKEQFGGDARIEIFQNEFCVQGYYLVRVDAARAAGVEPALPESGRKYFDA